MPETHRRSRATWAFIAVVALCVLGAGGYVLAGALASRAEPPAPKGGQRAAARSGVPPAGGRPLVSRSLDRSGGAATYGRLAWAPLSQPGRRTVTPLHCERVYFGGGRGMCRARHDGCPVSYRAIALDAGLKVTAKLKLGGVPSRTRISPSGRW